MKISDLLGDSWDTTDDPPAPVTPRPPTAARTQLSALAAVLPVPADEATEVARETPTDPISAEGNDGGIRDLEVAMGTTGEIADAEADTDVSELPTALEPAMDDLLPALRGRTGPRGASRSGSRRRGS